MVDDIAQKPWFRTGTRKARNIVPIPVLTFDKFILINSPFYSPNASPNAQEEAASALFSLVAFRCLLEIHCWRDLPSQLVFSTIVPILVESTNHSVYEIDVPHPISLGF